MKLDILMDKLHKLYDWACNLDWSSPKVILSAIALGIVPFVATYFVLTGMVIAMCLAISILFMVEKFPQPVKDWIHAHPLISDATLSAISVFGISTFFGSGAGLTLALGFIFLDVILAVTLPFATQPKVEYELTQVPV